MKLKLTILSIIAISLFVINISADQAAYITKAEADKAAAFLKDKKQVRHYCAPCDDKGDRVEDIANVKAVKVDYQNYWEVQINGKGIDLAYVYFRTKSGKWKNLAKELDIKVHEVPKTLPAKVEKVRLRPLFFCYTPLRFFCSSAFRSLRRKP